MANPRVTVCIPTWNGGEYIAEAVQSVLTQSFTDFEVIITDDQSTDSTVDIVRSLSDPRIALHVNEAQLGIPGNWNHALSRVRGEYVCLFHQDDRMRPDNLAQKVAILESDPAIGFVHSAVEILVEPSAPYPTAKWVENSAEDFIVDGLAYLRRLLLEGNLICAPTVVARQACLLRAGGFEVGLGFACDYALWMRLCLDWRVAFLSQPLVEYRWHAANETHHFRFEKGVEEVRRACLKVVAEYGERPGRAQEAEILRACVEALARVRKWAAELETAKEWLQGQVENWRQQAERCEQTIGELKGWNAELQTAKEWLEGQVENWRQQAMERESTFHKIKRLLSEEP